ncbi:hypothetical protein K3175_05720 [Qipengyuania sp. GH1]|uniref:hypothetical protein n=1 Tax=Qipengyuania aestuarii TaxID=2867241 RepID=UPI001C883030|nr:hypothetical protein [Qipengyuania aestuarii]MBX7535151.1 hypothetical protein [Qipengyuania aestuarii]
MHEAVRNWDSGEITVDVAQFRAPLAELQINGEPVELEVDPGFGSVRMLNSSKVRDLKLQPSGIAGGYRIGPITLTSRSSAVAISSENYSGPARVHWFPKTQVSEEADGLISPVIMPYARVRFSLRPFDAQDEVATLPLRGPGTYGVSGGFGIIDLAGKEVQVAFDLHAIDTFVSADLGTLLLKTHGGRFSGISEDRLIRYGVSRPVLQLDLNRPFDFAGIRFDSVLVEVERRGEAALENADPQTIIVTARRDPSDIELRLLVGRDAIKRCAYFQYDNAGGVVSLACSPSEGTG